MCHLQAFCSLPAKAQQEAERLSRVPRRLAPSQNTSASPDGDLKKMWHCNAGGSWGFKPNKDWWNKDSNWNSHSDGGCFLLLLSSSSSSFLSFSRRPSLLHSLWFSVCDFLFPVSAVCDLNSLSLFCFFTQLPLDFLCYSLSHFISLLLFHSFVFSSHFSFFLSLVSSLHPEGLVLGIC